MTFVRCTGMVAAIVVTILQVSFAAEPGAAPATTDEIRAIATAIEHSRHRLDHAQASVSAYQFTPHQVYDLERRDFDRIRGALPNRSLLNLPVGDKKETTTLQWYTRGDDMAESVVADRNDPAEISIYTRLVIKAGLAYRLDEYNDRSRPDLGNYHVGYIISPDKVITNGLWNTWQMQDPRYWAYYLGRPLDKVLMASDPPAKVEDHVTLDGSNCVMVEVTPNKGYIMNLWLDSDHGFIVRKEEGYIVSPITQILNQRVEVPRLLEDNGAWLPALVEAKQYVYGSNYDQSPAAIAKLSVVERRITVSNFSVDSTPPVEAFILDWPVGTQVTDNI